MADKIHIHGGHDPDGEKSKMHLSEHAAIGFFDLLSQLPQGSDVYLTSVFRDHMHYMHNEKSNHSKASSIDIKVTDPRYRSILDFFFEDYEHLDHDELNYGKNKYNKNFRGENNRLTLTPHGKAWLEKHNARILDERGRPGAAHFHIDFHMPGVTDVSNTYSFSEDGQVANLSHGKGENKHYFKGYYYGSRYKSYEEQTIIENGQEINWTESNEYKNILAYLDKSKVEHDEFGYVYDFSADSDFRINVLPTIKNASANAKGGEIISPIAQPEQEVIVGPEEEIKPLEFQYEIQKGDSLSKIAKKYNTTVEELMEANPYIKDKNKIYTGKTLTIPGETQPGGSSPTITTGDKYTGTKVNPQDIYNYLIDEHDISHNHAMGILANIAGESSFDSSAIGDNGASYGLFQYNKSGGRRENMIAFVGDDWKTDWKGQVDFIFEEDNKDSRMNQYLGNDYATIEDAAHSFMINFERPANKSKANSKKRVNKLYNNFATEEVLQKGYENKDITNNELQDPQTEFEEIIEKIDNGDGSAEEIIKELESVNEKINNQQNSKKEPKPFPVKVPDDATIEHGAAYWTDENGNPQTAVLNDDGEWVQYSEEDLVIYDEGLGSDWEDEEDEEEIVLSIDDTKELITNYQEEYQNLLEQLDTAGPDEIPEIKERIKELDNLRKGSEGILGEWSDEEILELNKDKTKLSQLDWDGDGIPDLLDGNPALNKNIGQDDEYLTTKDMLSRYMPMMQKNLKKIYSKIFGPTKDEVIEWMRGETNGVPNSLFVEFFGGDHTLYKNLYTKEEANKTLIKSYGKYDIRNQPQPYPEQKFTPNAGVYFKMSDWSFTDFHEDGSTLRVMDWSKDTVFFIPAEDFGVLSPNQDHHGNLDYWLDDESQTEIFLLSNLDNMIAFNSEEELHNHAGPDGVMIKALTNEDLNRALDNRPVDGFRDYAHTMFNQAVEASSQADWEERMFTSYEDYTKPPFQDYQFSDQFKAKYFRGIPHDDDTGLPYTPSDIDSLYTRPEDVNIIVPGGLNELINTQHGDPNKGKLSFGSMLVPGGMINDFENLIDLKQEGYIVDLHYGETVTPDGHKGVMIYPPGSTVDKHGAWVNQHGYAYYWDSNGNFETATKFYTYEDFAGGIDIEGDSLERGMDFMSKIADVENGGFWDVKTSTMFTESGVYRDSFGRLKRVDENGIEYKMSDDIGNIPSDSVVGYWRPTNKGVKTAKELGMIYDDDTDHFFKKGSYKKNGVWFTADGLEILLNDRNVESYRTHHPKNLKNSETFKRKGWKWNSKENFWMPPEAYRGEDGRWYINQTVNSQYGSTFDIVENQTFENKRSNRSTIGVNWEGPSGNADNVSIEVAIPITKDKYFIPDPDDEGYSSEENWKNNQYTELAHNFTYVYDGDSDEQTYPGLIKEGTSQMLRAKQLYNADVLANKGYVWSAEHRKWFQPGVTKNASGEYVDENGYVYRQNRRTYSNGTPEWTWQHTPTSMQNEGWVKVGDGYLPPGTYVDDDGELRVMIGGKKNDLLDKHFWYKDVGDGEDEGESHQIFYNEEDGYYWEDDEGEKQTFNPVNNPIYRDRNFLSAYSKSQSEELQELGYVKAQLEYQWGDEFDGYAGSEHTDTYRTNYLPPGSYQDDEGIWRDENGNRWVLTSTGGGGGLDSTFTPVAMDEAQYENYIQGLDDSMITNNQMESLVGKWDPLGRAQEKITNFFKQHGESALTALQAGVGLIGLGKALKDIPVEERPKLSADFKAFQRMSKEMATSGMDPKTKYAMRNELTNAYNFGIKNALRASGGSRATFLANAGVLNANRVEGLLKMGALDSQQRLKNVEHYGKVLNFAEEFTLKGKTVENKAKYDEAVRKSQVWGTVGSSILGKILGDMSYKETMKHMQPMIEEGMKNMQYQFEDMFSEWEEKMNDQVISNETINPEE